MWMFSLSCFSVCVRFSKSVWVSERAFLFVPSSPLFSCFLSFFATFAFSIAGRGARVPSFSALVASSLKRLARKIRFFLVLILFVLLRIGTVEDFLWSGKGKLTLKHIIEQIPRERVMPWNRDVHSSAFGPKIRLFRYSESRRQCCCFGSQFPTNLGRIFASRWSISLAAVPSLGVVSSGFVCRKIRETRIKSILCQHRSTVYRWLRVARVTRRK